MSAFDPEMFSELLKKAVGSRSAKEFSKDAGISRYQVSRRLNAALSAPPRKSTLSAISSVAQNNVTYEQLLICCGYEDTPDRTIVQHPDEHNVKKARACILANMDSLNASCKLPVCAPQIPGDFELLVGEDPCVCWDFVCLSPSVIPSEVECTLNRHYLDLMYRRFEAYSKLSFLTDQRDLFDECKARQPVNLDANVSVILYEPDLLEVVSEEVLSESKTMPLPDGTCSFPSEDI